MWGFELGGIPLGLRGPCSISSNTPRFGGLGSSPPLPSQGSEGLGVSLLPISVLWVISGCSPGREQPKQPQGLGLGLCRKFCVSASVPCPGLQVLGTCNFLESMVGKAGFRWEKLGLNVAFGQQVKHWEFWC